VCQFFRFGGLALFVLFVVGSVTAGDHCVLYFFVFVCVFLCVLVVLLVVDVFQLAVVDRFVLEVCLGGSDRRAFVSVACVFVFRWLWSYVSRCVLSV
jgi:hypothetical protein